MSLILKAALAVVLLLAVADASVHHRHQKKGQYQRPGHDLPGASLEDLVETHITGKITCNGNGVDFVRPYLHSDLYPRTIINIVKATDGGEYHLNTGILFDTRGSIDLTVRHQCRIEELPPMKGCAVPYYTTTITIPLDPKVNRITRNLELFEMKRDSTADCLY
uniref:Phosphatidylglycerol/phosphatidylinositol transfer protein n=1 Tax=Caenorhabditis tropicalis TaxID=1561998 RepID=A0A1I7UDK1_9PELO